MGLTVKSTGHNSLDKGLIINKKNQTERVVALAGNPNVGKSTVFNALTGLNQHTGNWPGKTVSNAMGKCHTPERDWTVVDLPGTYSLMAHSAEEEAARDFICFGNNGVPADVVVVVCDATCLERNLNLVLQTIEITPNTIACINLMDEAKHKGIQIDINMLEKKLGIPVVPASARSGEGLENLVQKMEDLQNNNSQKSIKIIYHKAIEEAISLLQTALDKIVPEWPENKFTSRWLALRLICKDEKLCDLAGDYLKIKIKENFIINNALAEAHELLKKAGLEKEEEKEKEEKEEALHDKIVSALIHTAEEICSSCVFLKNRTYNTFDRRLDKILTSKLTGVPIMLALLSFIFWLTITGANYPSEILGQALFWLQDRLSDFFAIIGAPDWLHGMLVLGVFRTLAWVVSVMLPPMAIFFPLFTLLEDFGYLPRVAFNLDHHFKKANACGKQALSMCMGFGCNAAGVVGCRIIDSPRERLIAIITNNFVPCNGRFPILIAIITMFFAGSAAGVFEGILSTVILTSVILLGIALTFLVSKALSFTILKGVPSSFTLELPPYRRPQIGKVIIRSLLDRTLFVLGRAVAVAAPAGLLIWLMANIDVAGISVLAHCSGFLDPFARFLGMDGVILLAFILGFPANEIVIPIIIMAYLSSTTMLEMTDLHSLKILLVDNGWTWITAVSTMLFCLIHWPCSTTCLTIRKETKSLKWTAISFAIPTIIGMLVCFLFTFIARTLSA